MDCVLLSTLELASPLASGVDWALVLELELEPDDDLPTLPLACATRFALSCSSCLQASVSSGRGRVPSDCASSMSASTCDLHAGDSL
eukprot:CAMPEP_0114435172 /NCGR_PEP_ID=MMETSP0103-20121206/12674_1 /TAXON_ID=37642 ORGANISM="Paraphysomonas imperforata, Strain PA2" /NCGR_SAMPLE_ID=MMETSP0103 /ASSEMBLY_ACC=CAM_ASM_000201 /LENGTH=86 /DNA_ID=CAMNT_0001605151 /DNA_START=249 /DNA_END=509 /DNA_ORIENTATION=-